MIRGHRGHQVNAVRVDRRDQLDRRDRQAIVESKDQGESREHRGRMDKLDHRDHGVNQVLRDRKETKERGVSLALRDKLVPMDSLDQLVFAVSLDSQDRRVNWEDQVPEVNRVLLATLDVPASLVNLDQRDQLDQLGLGVNRDNQEPVDNVDHKVKYIYSFVKPKTYMCHIRDIT